MVPLAPLYGWSYVIGVVIASFVVLFWGVLLSNLSPRRRYPTFWW